MSNETPHFDCGSQCFALLLALLMLLADAVVAQEFRGTVSGAITDQSGAVIPGARVAAKNQETNVVNEGVSNESGGYRIPFLIPGVYEVTVEAQGFKKASRQNIEVRVNDRLEVNFSLEAGSISDTVTVTSETTPLLSSESGSLGQVVDRRRINDLPLQDGNPFSLVRLAPTIFQYGTLRSTLPFNLAVPGQVVASGTFGGSEFSLDGIPNQIQPPNNGAREGTRPGYQPPADAVEEFKVTINSYDAQEGHTAAANINVTLRSGKNQFFGTAYEFIRNEALNANEFFANRAGVKKPPFRYNRWGGSVGGPVFLPRFGEGGPSLYNGRNKTFFFFVYENLPLTVSPAGVFTVPTEAMRRGDFSELLPQNIRIYDPDPTKVTRLANGQFQRAAFPGNIIPADRLNPLALQILALYPLPNQAGNNLKQNNYFSANPAIDQFNSQAFRIDHSFNENNRTYFRFSRNHRINNFNRLTPEINGYFPSEEVRDALAQGGAIDHVWTVSPTLFLNVRTGLNHYFEQQYGGTRGKVELGSFGFSPRFLSQVVETNQLPRIGIGGFSFPSTRSFVNYFVNDVVSLQPTATKIAGNHSLKFGYDGRIYQRSAQPSTITTGDFAFNGEFTRQLSNGPTLQGQAFAQFLLGIPSGGSIPRNDTNVVRVLSHAGFVQDDWKVSSRLTLNLGLRYDYDGPATERYDRAIVKFDITAQNPIEVAARAAYAARPIPEVAPDSFRVRGGTRFAGDGTRDLYNPDGGKFSPRGGVAYSLNQKTVVRGGVGWYTIPFTYFFPDQGGYSISTPIVSSVDNTLTPLVTFADPYPNSIIEPIRNTLGLASSNGLGSSFYGDERKHGRALKYTLSVQRELPGQWVIELGYSGSHGYDQAVSRDVNPLPVQYLSRNPTRDVAQINFLNAQVPNPFRGLTPLNPGFSNAANTSRAQLLRPYPQLSSLATEIYDGTSDYNALIVTGERRFSAGYTLNVAYTFSKLIEKLAFTNPQDAELERFISTADVPHRLAVSGIYELPFGRGRRWANSMPGVLEAVLGGWQTQGIFIYQSGAPLTLPNFYYNGDPTNLEIDINSRTIGEDAAGNNRLTGVRTILDRSGFYTLPNGTVLDVNNQAQLTASIQLESNYRTLPRALSNLRQDEINNVDLSVSKNFMFGERAKLQLRAEFLNAFNHPIFDDPVLNPLDGNFARVNSQRNLARNIQLGVKFSF